MLADCHLHLENRGGKDFFQNPEEFIAQGEKRNVDIFGFSDHAYIFHEAKDINFNSWQRERCWIDVAEYISEMERLKKKHDNILVGLEIDYIPEKEKEIREFIEKMKKIYPFDYFIGSVHWLGEWGFDLDQKEYQEKMNERGAEKVYQDYFHSIQKLIESQLFDVVGHIDLIKIFGAKIENKNYQKEIIELLKSYNQTIEINTNGKNKPIGEVYPDFDFVRECVAQNIPLTLGSDAHTADRVGESFDEVCGNLLAIGCSQVVSFRGHKSQIIELC